MTAHSVPAVPPRAIVHIGEPKTGTTFLQQVMWRNRGELAAAGVLLPGHHPQDHFRAQNDLRDVAKLPSDPAGSWAAEWDVLALQAREAPGVSVISHELFCAADAAQAQRAVKSLRPVPVHVVLTVRDMGSLLPAEWQETIKHRNDRTWTDWLHDVIDTESVAPDRREYWFWRVHDTMAILDIWSRLLPPEQVHVITVPPQGSGNTLLWERFAGLLGIDPARADTSRARPNASLGVPEIEFLRRLNMGLSPEIPDWFYMWNVKETLAHRTLAERPRTGRLVLPADREAWAGDQAETLIAALKESRYDVIGDLDELRRGRPAGSRPGPTTRRRARCSTRPWRPPRPRCSSTTAGFTRRPGRSGRPSRRAAWSAAWSRRWPSRTGSRRRSASSAPGTRPSASSGCGCGRRLSAAGSGGTPSVAGDQPAVAAVVVTYNRRALLMEALAAVQAQTRPADTVIVVDNASTDESAAAVAQRFPAARLERLARNTGGAGGFAFGLAAALAAAPRPPGRPDLADGRRHHPRAGRAGRPAGGPRPLPAGAARADREPGGLDRRPAAPDEHAAGQAVRPRERAPGRRRGPVPADPLRVVRLGPGRRRGHRAARPAPGRLLPVERRLRVHHPAAARPGRPAVPGQRGRP